MHVKVKRPLFVMQRLFFYFELKCYINILINKGIIHPISQRFNCIIIMVVVHIIHFIIFSSNRPSRRLLLNIIIITKH